MMPIIDSIYDPEYDPFLASYDVIIKDGDDALLDRDILGIT